MGAFHFSGQAALNWYHFKDCPLVSFLIRGYWHFRDFPDNPPNY